MERLDRLADRDRVTLTVGGRVYWGWESISVQSGVEQLAGGFSLVASDSWPDEPEQWAVAPGDSCVVKIGDTPVITGYIDIVRVLADAKSHVINIQGRDKTGDLVDCSAPSKEFINQPFEAIAVDLLRPFWIELLTQVQTGSGTYQQKKLGKGAAPKTKAARGGASLPKKASNSGETVHKVLEKLAKMQGVFLISDGTGALVISQPGLNGRADDALVVGENIIKIDYEKSFANLFSQITVKGQAHGAQTAAPGAFTNDSSARVKPLATVVRAATKASTTSASIARYRPLIIVADEQATAAQCATRAQWEAGSREAKSRKLVVTVQGWRQSTGKLWEKNTIVRVKSQFTRDDEDLLIAHVDYKLDHGGTICVLTVYPPKAYEVLKEIPKPTTPTTPRGLGKFSKT